MTTQAVKQNKGNRNILVTLLLIAVVIAFAVLPLIFVKDGEFGGSDGKAQEAITEINADYQPWFSPLFEPKSGEVESLLFSLQAALGAGVVFYGIGYMRGKSKRETDKQ